MSKKNQQNRSEGPVPERPQMPASYGVDRLATSGTLPWSFVDDRMASSRNYWIATTRPNGHPHTVPVWGIWLDETFYFATDPGSQKGRNLSLNPALVVHLESGDDVVILEGAAEVVTDESLLTRFAEAYDAKYQFRPNVNSPETVVYRLKARVALAWTEHDFPQSATRWTFQAER